MSEQPKKEIKIEITPEVAAGNYANLAVISNSPNEFFLDFIQMVPNMPQARVQTRVVMTPENAKIFSDLLRDTLIKYQNVFGAITIKKPLNPNGNPGDNFSA